MDISSILPELRGIFLSELGELINRYSKVSAEKGGATRWAVVLISCLIHN